MCVIDDITTPSFPAGFPSPSPPPETQSLVPEKKRKTAAGSVSVPPSSTASDDEPSLEQLSSTVDKHKMGDEVEAITHPGYTRATRKRKRKEMSDSLDKTLAKGRMAFIDIPNDDPKYRLRLGLVKLTQVSSDRLDFQWYTYSGYPDAKTPSYSATWHLQILKGKGQKVDTGFCHPSAVVLTFDRLTGSKTIPSRGRLAPLKMIRRALDLEFGPLPQQLNSIASDDSDSSYNESSSDSDEDERSSITSPLTRSKARGKHRVK